MVMVGRGCVWTDSDVWQEDSNQGHIGNCMLKEAGQLEQTLRSFHMDHLIHSTHSYFGSNLVGSNPACKVLINPDLSRITNDSTWTDIG